MALSTPRQFFGIHSVSPYSRSDGTFYGILKVLAGSSLNFAGELVEVYGGSQKFSWAIEDGQIKAEMSLKVKELPDFLWTLFFGKAPSSASTDTTGTIGTAANKKGTSIIAATGILSTVKIKPSTGSADLKFGKYVVKAASTTTVDVYLSTDIDAGAKTNALAFQNDLLKITSSPLTITTGADVDVPNTGLQLTGGAGTIGMTVGDTATFTVLPPSSKSSSVVVGAAANVFPEFGAIVMGQRRSSGELVEVDVYRAKAVGFPLPFDEFKWAETEIKAKVFYDSAQDAVFAMRTVTET